MKSDINVVDYWFTIEPYVFVGITNQCALLYNTLDGAVLESDKAEVIELLRETIQKDNCGVILLIHERYCREDINIFINNLREKFMGDIIDVAFSDGKPIQLFPYYNYLDKNIIIKNIYSNKNKNALENLSEISIYLDSTIDIKQFVHFLKSIPGVDVFNIIGDIEEVDNCNELLLFLTQHTSDKYILFPYTNAISLPPEFEDYFMYRMSVNFPIDLQQWEKARQISHHQTLPIEYVFDVISDEDILHAEEIIEKYKIEKYKLNPIYNGENIRFFEENVFLTKEDILSASISIKDFFIRQSMNIYDFGKINIMSNGDAYANVNRPILGNIYTHSIYEIVQKEIDEGKSWFHIRNQAPCDTCIYQWLCPSPSNYEIIIGRPNLCHVKN